MKISARTHSIMRVSALLLTLIVLVVSFSACGSSGTSSGGLGVYPKAVGAADEASAIQVLRTIATAQAQLKTTSGAYGSFQDLTQAGMLDQRFAGLTPNLRGYQFTMTVTDSDYTVNADPQSSETQPAMGGRHFCLNSSDNTIHVNSGQSASKNDPVL